MTTARRLAAASLALVLGAALAPALGAAGCARDAKDEHGDRHGHPHGAEEGPEPIAITRWTDRYELFVELPPPAPGKPVPYHAHVTRLEGFQAVTEGSFRVRYKTAAGVAAEAQINGVKRAGIFTPEGPAPAAGTYSLEMVYEHGGEAAVFDCGEITVADTPPAAAPAAPGAAISFLKETQWRIPFATAWAEERALARELELPATVEPAGSDQLTVGAPTGGRFFHDPKIKLAEGLRLRKGDVIGRIVPNVAGDDYSRLELAAEEARLARAQIEREIARIEPLVKDGLAPERRLIELRNELEALSARGRSAEARLSRVRAPGGAGGIPLRSTLEGVVSEVLVPNGEPVEAGAPLVRVGGTDHVWIRSRFVARPAGALEGAQPAGVRLPEGGRVDLAARGARFLSALPVVDPASRLATWIAEVPPAPADSKEPALRPGASVVLVLRVGAPRKVVAVPRTAVVEINTRPYVFVQTEGESFEKRPVRPGDTDGGFVEILSGVAAGERVVTEGGFDIHLGSLMGTVESHRH